MYVSVFVARGDITVDLVNLINREVCFVTDMTRGGIKPVVWQFPTDNVKGGVGFTHVQPIVESFIVSDWWTEHGHLYYVFASCKEYNSWYVRSVLERNELDVVEHRFFSVNGKRKRVGFIQRILRWIMRWVGAQRHSIFFIH